MRNSTESINQIADKIDRITHQMIQISFALEHKLPLAYNNWPTSMQVLFKLTY